MRRALNIGGGLLLLVLTGTGWSPRQPRLWQADIQIRTLEVLKTKTGMTARVVVYTEHDDEARDARLLVLLPVGVGIERVAAGCTASASPTQVPSLRASVHCDLGIIPDRGIREVIITTSFPPGGLPKRFGVFTYSNTPDPQPGNNYASVSFRELRRVNPSNCAARESRVANVREVLSMFAHSHLKLSALLILSLAITERANAQIGGLIKKKAAEAVKDAKKVPPKDSVKTAPKTATDTTKPATSATTPGTAPSAAPTTAPASSTQSAAPAPADSKIWDNYDFVPGNRVIFFTDFSEDKVGNFARGLKYAGGQMDVVERDGIKVLRATERSTILIPVGKQLPQRFTLEIDVIAPRVACCGYEVISFEGNATRLRSATSAEIHWHPNGTVIIGGGQTLGGTTVNIPDAQRSQLMGTPVHVRVLMDSAYFKMYVNERRMYNIPELPFRRDSIIRLSVFGSPEENKAVFITNIRVAESETDVLYDALASKGRWATQGILFATGKADIQPESRPVLKEIASTLQKYGDLKILIEGHTDNVGTSASNLALSDARAAAVKAALVANFGVGADRITTKGLGDTKPSVPNTNAAGRAQNRRVEVVKQ